MTVWVLLSLTAAAVLCSTAYVLWRKWIAPWSMINELIGDIIRGRRPRSYLITGATEARKLALALEHVFERQFELDRQLVERTLGTEAIVGAMQEGLLVVDHQNRVIMANRALRELLGLPEVMPSAPLLEIIRNVEIDRLIRKTLQTGDPAREEAAITASDGTRHIMELSAVAVRDRTDHTTGVAVLFHDISELKKTDEIRRDFVANVSHELRTPLSILRGYIETLGEDQELSTHEFRRILEVMERHSDRLTALTDDLLSLARLESGESDLHLDDVRVSELFAGIVRDWGNRFADKSLSLDVAISPAVPAIRADPIRLQEVLYNLLDNAVKYSPPNSKIRLQANRRDDYVLLSVSDTGIGIPGADLPRIFERFYRADKARSRELGGTGLGLSIVKHIAQMHGGAVEAESEPGQGTTIRVVLPLKPARNPSNTAALDSEPSTGATGPGGGLD